MPDVFRVGFGVALQNAPGLFGETAGPFGCVVLVNWFWFAVHDLNMAFRREMSATNRSRARGIKQK